MLFICIIAYNLSHYVISHERNSVCVVKNLLYRIDTQPHCLCQTIHFDFLRLKRRHHCTAVLLPLQCPLPPLHFPVKWQEISFYLDHSHEPHLIITCILSSSSSLSILSSLASLPSSSDVSAVPSTCFEIGVLLLANTALICCCSTEAAIAGGKVMIDWMIGVAVNALWSLFSCKADAGTCISKTRGSGFVELGSAGNLRSKKERENRLLSSPNWMSVFILSKPTWFELVQFLLDQDR